MYYNEYIDDAKKTCESCDLGYSCDGVNQQKCGPGSYCKKGEKFYCVKGKYGYLDGQSEEAESCTDCEQGTFQPGVGQRSCYECLGGFYNPEKGKKKREDCLPCQNGRSKLLYFFQHSSFFSCY